MLNLKKKIPFKVAILIIIFFAFVLIGIPAYVRWASIYNSPVFKAAREKELQAKALKQTLKAETVNWQGYENKGYGYGIKYPEDWFLRKNCEGIVGASDYCGKEKAGFSDKVTYDEIVNPQNQCADCVPKDDIIDIHVAERGGSSSRDYLMYLVTVVDGYPPEKVAIEEKNSIQGLHYLLHKDPIHPIIFQKAIFQNKDYFYRIDFTDNSKKSAANLQIFNNMINTFTFVP